MPLESVYLNGGFIGTTTSYQLAQAGITQTITYVGSASSDNSTTIDLTGISMQPGDIVLVISGDDSGTPGTATGYTSLASISSTGDVNVMYKIMPDPVDTSVTGLTAGGSDSGHLAVVFRGVDQTTPIDATTTTATNTAGDPDPGAVTTATDGAMVVAFAFLDDDLISTPTAPSGYTLADFNTFGSSGAGGSVMAVYKIEASAGPENPGTIVTNGDDWWWTLTVPLRPGTITIPSNDGNFNLNAVLETLAPPNIVTSGLVLALDAGDPRSYPGTGTTWFDTSGNGNNGTIQSGVSYNTKYFTFDGTTNGYVSLPLLSSSTTNITMLALVNMPASDGGAIFYNGSNGGYGIGVGSSTFDNSGNDAIGLFQFVRWIDSNITWGTGWMMVGLSLNGSSVPSFIKNDSVIGTFSGTAPNTPVTNAALGVDVPGGGRNFAGDIAWAAFYSRELSISEIEQNYNAIKGRFGL